MQGKLKKKRGRKKTKKRDVIQTLRFLNQWLFNPSLDNHSILTQDVKYFYSNLIYRLYSLCESKPLLMVYLNEYMNSRDINQYKFEPIEVLQTFAQIFKMFGIVNSNMLYYSKYKENEQKNFNKLISQYLNEINCDYTYRDLSALYHLFNNGIITETQLKEIECILKGESFEEQSEQEQIPTAFHLNKFKSNSKDKISATPPLSEDVKTLNESIIKYIQNRALCKKCPLYKRPKVIFEANLDHIDMNDFTKNTVDVVFVGLNPGKDEVTNKRPFIGKAGQLFRSYLQVLMDNLYEEHNIKLKFLITNVILSSTNNENDIPSPKKVINNCRELHEKLLKVFNPRYIVLIGNKACNAYGLKGSMKSLNGKIFEDRIIPIVHPSYILRGNKSGEKMLRDGFAVLYDILTNSVTDPARIEEIQPQQQEFSIPEDALLSRFSPDLTLFDVSIVGDKVIYIMIDDQGRKRYIIQDFVFPIYIKQGQYKDCKYIEDEVDFVANLNNQQKEKLQRMLYSQMTKMVKI